jgi:hypothetical protein
VPGPASLSAAGPGRVTTPLGGPQWPGASPLAAAWQSGTVADWQAGGRCQHEAQWSEAPGGRRRPSRNAAAAAARAEEPAAGSTPSGRMVTARARQSQGRGPAGPVPLASGCHRDWQWGTARVPSHPPLAPAAVTPRGPAAQLSPLPANPDSDPRTGHWPTAGPYCQL